MPPHKHIPSSAADWLARAKSDIAIAKTPLPEGAFYEILTRFAWESRYPYLGEQVTEEEYREAVRQAETVIAWAEKQIK